MGKIKLYEKLESDGTHAIRIIIGKKAYCAFTHPEMGFNKYKTFIDSPLNKGDELLRIGYTEIEYNDLGEFKKK